MSAIDLKEISKSYREVRALKAVSLTISKGEFFGLLGPNGAGKSTLMQLISGFQKPDTGEIKLNDISVEDKNGSVRKKLGLVPQDLALYQNLSAMQNLSIFASLYHLPGSIAKERSENLLQSVDLYDRRHSKVKTFSGGMKRRLNLILALLHEPDILLCDEPTVGVDPQSRNAIFEFLEEQNEKGLTIIYTTHYMEEAERLCSRIGIIDHGEIKAIGTRSELLKLTKERPQLLFPELITPPDNLFQGQGEWHTFQNGYVFKPNENVRLSQLFQLMESNHIDEDKIQVRQPSLEGVFLNLTGKELRN